MNTNQETSINFSGSAQPAAPRSGRYHGYALSVILAIGLLLRLACLGQESLWADEYYSVFNATQPNFRALHAAVWSQGLQVPYFIILRFFISALGNTDFVVRLPSAIFGFLALPMMYLLALNLFPERRRFALLATALLALSPMHVWYSQEARPYALQVLVELCAFWALARGLRGGAVSEKSRIAWLAGAVVLIAAALEIHSFSIFLWMAVNVMIFLAGWRWRMISKRAATGLLALMLAAALHSFGVIINRLFYRSFLQGSYPNSYGPSLVLEVQRAQLLGPHWSALPRWLQLLGIGLGSGLCILGAWRLYQNRRGSPGATALPVVGWLLAIAAPVAISFIKPIIFYGQRYLIIGVPFTVLLVAANFIDLRKSTKILVTGLVCIVALLQCAYFVPYYQYRQKHLWDGVAAFLNGKIEKGAKFYVMPDRDAGLLSRYMKRGAPVGGLPIDGAKVAAAIGKDPGVSIFIVYYADLRDWLGKLNLGRPVAVGVYETHQPGQALWVHEIQGKK